MKTSTGETIKGKIEAVNVKQAAAVLKEKNLFIVSIEDSMGSALQDINALLDRVKTADVVNFTRQLSTMITAGLTLTESFRILAQQSRPAMGKIITTLQRDVEGGSSFADALEKQKKVFSKVYIALVRSGEAAGVLDQVLKRLADNLEKQAEFASKTKGALIYPIIVVIAMIGVASIMMIFVIPKLTAMYADFGAQLPLVTRILVVASNFMASYWYVVFGTMAVALAVFRTWKKTEIGERTMDKFVLKIPVFGTLRVKVMMAEFTRTISLLLGAGVSLLQTLRIVSDSLENVLFRDALKGAAEDVEKGMGFSEALSKYELFPALVGQMVAVGEETGKLDEVLMKVSGYYENESEQAIKNLSTALEPMIMVVLGVGVGFLIIAIITPIYNLTSQF
ncbi:MAG TPA: type II secretion system F family protein [Candidatus Saccharimonadia bacterium]|nr:type II secretion system F family protein [Candidatus Saccharimonadia bacterium]